MTELFNRLMSDVGELFTAHEQAVVEDCQAGTQSKLPRAAAFENRSHVFRDKWRQELQAAKQGRDVLEELEELLGATGDEVIAEVRSLLGKKSRRYRDAR